MQSHKPGGDSTPHLQCKSRTEKAHRLYIILPQACSLSKYFAFFIDFAANAASKIELVTQGESRYSLVQQVLRENPLTR